MYKEAISSKFKVANNPQNFFGVLADRMYLFSSLTILTRLLEDIKLNGMKSLYGAMTMLVKFLLRFECVIKVVMTHDEVNHPYSFSSCLSLGSEFIDSAHRL